MKALAGSRPPAALCARCRCRASRSVLRRALYWATWGRGAPGLASHSLPAHQLRAQGCPCSLSALPACNQVSCNRPCYCTQLLAQLHACAPGTAKRPTSVVCVAWALTNAEVAAGEGVAAKVWQLGRQRRVRQHDALAQLRQGRCVASAAAGACRRKGMQVEAGTGLPSLRLGRTAFKEGVSSTWSKLLAPRQAARKGSPSLQPRSCVAQASLSHRRSGLRCISAARMANSPGGAHS